LHRERRRFGDFTASTMRKAIDRAMIGSKRFSIRLVNL